MKSSLLGVSRGNRICVTACALLSSLAGPLHAAGTVAANAAPPGYHRSEVSIAMRDGVHLDTVILAPTDATSSYPILLVRSPYDLASDWMTPEPQFLAAKYIFVFQSVRGR